MPIIIHPSPTGSAGKSALIVNVTGTAGGTDGTSDKTYTQILEAINRNQAVQAIWNNTTHIPLFSHNSSAITFQTTSGTLVYQIVINSNNSVLISSSEVELITTEDIDTICGTTIQLAAEVTF